MNIKWKFRIIATIIILDYLKGVLVVMEFKITENAIRDLLTTYADHYLMCKNIEKETDDDDLCDDADYAHHKACCCTAEQWMRAVGIHPESNYVMEIINKERDFCGYY